MHNLMLDLKKDLIGIPRTKNEIAEIVGKLISETFRTDILICDANEVDIGDLNFSAYYDYELDSMNRPCIQVYFVFNPLDNTLIFDEELFNNVVKRLCDTISHEQIHQRQYRSRFWEDTYNVDIDNPVSYLSNKDEIDAYSYNIANELLDYANHQNVLTILTEASKITVEQSVNLWVYVNLFGGANNPTIKRLLKKVIKVLPDVVKER